MQRRKCEAHLKDCGCVFVREGAKHRVYANPQNGKSSTLPRHNEIPDRLFMKICKDLGIPAPQSSHKQV